MFQKLWTQGSCNIIYRRYVVCIKYIIVNNPHKGDDDDDNDDTLKSTSLKVQNFDHGK